MSTFIAQTATKPSIKIETSMCVNTGYFGTILLEYGACHIGAEIWIKHGLTEEDKKAFETYQNGCEELIGATIEDPIWFTSQIDDIVAYELATPSEKRAKIVEIIMEIDAQYEIGNWKSYVFEEEEDLPQTPCYDTPSPENDEENMEDWYERQREIRYQHAIENSRDDFGYDSN